MWSRFVIIVLGAWMLASPIVFQHSSKAQWPLIDVGCGLLLVLFAAASWWRRAAAAAPLIILLGALLIGAAYADFGNPPPAAQNRAVVGLLAMLFGSVLPRTPMTCRHRSRSADAACMARRLPATPARPGGDSYVSFCCDFQPGRRRGASRQSGRGDRPDSRL